MHSWTDPFWKATRIPCIEGMIIGGYAMGAISGRDLLPCGVSACDQETGDRYGTGQRKRLSWAKTSSAAASTFDICGSRPAPAHSYAVKKPRLIASLEGERGMPRLKPPFPAAKGLLAETYGYQQRRNTCKCSLDHLSTVGLLSVQVRYRKESKGTKVFALAGKIKKGGLVEVPMGHDAARCHVSVSAAASKTTDSSRLFRWADHPAAVFRQSLIDTPVTYEDINKTGAIVGSGGMIVMDEDTCMVDMARYFLNFTRDESCGKCNYCRIGTKRMLEILERITEGEGKDGDIELLEELAGKIKDGSMCGLGQTAPNPVLTTLKYFRNEYEDHIYNKKCTAASCKALISFSINDACKGCTLCARHCPVGAISGKVKEKHVIDQDLVYQVRQVLRHMQVRRDRKEIGRRNNNGKI